MNPLRSILDAPMICEQCGSECTVGEAIPCAGGGTGLGCPQPDCGGLLRSVEN